MKKFLLGLTMVFVCIASVYALTNNFVIDSSQLSFTSSGKKDAVLDSFNSSYALNSSIDDGDTALEEEITNLTKKTTYLLLGDFNTDTESSEEYYKRHQEYLDMGAYQSFPKDSNTSSGYDESIDNYSYASISELAVPSIFLKFNELGIKYSYYGDIRITKSNNLVISTITLPKVTMKEENANDSMKYDLIETNLVITYYFIKINDEYKLAYLFGESKDELENYFTELENTEAKNSLNMAPSYDSNLRKIYDYSKLDALTNQEIANVYALNYQNIVTLNSYYNNYSVASANGFFINEGLVITTWNFIEKSLIEAQFIAIKDSQGNTLEIDGIVTANPDTDIAVIKVKNKANTKVTLGDIEKVNIEDPVISISSKTGVGLTTQKGIILSKDGYIQSAIPLTSTDEGSPLFDKNGNVIGLNTSKQTDTSISLSIKSDILKEVQDKFNNIAFDSIETISFEDLKEEYYYVKYNDEVIANNIPSRKWKNFSKVGDIEDAINLELVKASYKNGTVSLRYKNNISKYIDSMQLASTFRENLINDGFKEVLSGSKKYIYKNNKYQVIIMDEFNYLIVVMVKL